MTSRVYHSKYSKETLALIEKCITDFKLTTLQKKAILDDLQRGKPIPDLVAPAKTQPMTTTATLSRVKKNTQFPLKRVKKRRIETMMRCGAYDIPVYAPDKKIVDGNNLTQVDREKEKQRLRDIFYGLDQIPEDEVEHASDTTHKNQADSQKSFEFERMKELMDEIEDRIQFLQSMEQYGLQKKYNFEISNEIAQKRKQLEDLQKSIRNNSQYLKVAHINRNVDKH